MTDTVTIAEYGLSRPVALNSSDLAMLQGIPAERLWPIPTTQTGMFTFRASSWVGVVQLDSVRVRIMPKVDELRNVLMMFGAAAGITEWSPRAANFAEGDLVEGVAELLLRTIDQATRRGLLHGYRTQEERLPVLRGRLLIAELASRPWEPWPAPCRYDEFTADVPENRVLLAAVDVVRRWTVTPQVRRLAAELTARFEEVAPPEDPLLEADLVLESPLNAHYQPALALAGLVLEGFGVTHAAGSATAVSFLVDMNVLFERWIGTELTSRLWPLLDVAEQATVPLSRRPSVPMRPDLLFRAEGRPTLVGDVKYKVTGSGIARNADYYQLLAYVTALELPRGILIYCQADEAPEREITVLGGGQTIICHRLSLGGTWEDVGVALDRLAHSVRGLAQVGFSAHPGRRWTS